MATDWIRPSVQQNFSKNLVVGKCDHGALDVKMRMPGEHNNKYVSWLLIPRLDTTLKSQLLLRCLYDQMSHPMKHTFLFLFSNIISINKSIGCRDMKIHMYT